MARPINEQDSQTPLRALTSVMQAHGFLCTYNINLKMMK